MRTHDRLRSGTGRDAGTDASLLAAAVLDVRPLTLALPSPVRVTAAPTVAAPLRTVLDAIAGRLGIPAPRPVAAGAADPLTVFERAVSARLDREVSAVLAADAAGLDRVAGLPPADLDRGVADAVAAAVEGRCERFVVRAADGVRFPAYATGPRDAPVVALVAACGMPAEFAGHWLRRLGTTYRVLLYESRGLFGPDRGPLPAAGADLATDLAAQAGDLLAVLDHAGVRRAHVVGLCGGAVVALAAAASAPDRVATLGLWHGDYLWGDDGPETPHQANLRAVLTMAAEAGDPAGVHDLVCRALLGGEPPRSAHLVLYPYATADLLRTYARLNGAIMTTDVRAYLPAVTAPTLVVTSRDDTTAHPDGSRAVAAGLRDAQLLVTPHGDHLSLFEAYDDRPAVAADFIERGSTRIVTT